MQSVCSTPQYLEGTMKEIAGISYVRVRNQHHEIAVFYSFVITGLIFSSSFLKPSTLSSSGSITGSCPGL